MKWQAVLDWKSNITQWFDRFITPVDDPGSRLFHLNLSISLLFILFWIFLTFKDVSFSQALRRTKHLVFRKKYWWNRSTKVDYKIYLFNSILKILLFIPFLDFSFRISRFVVKQLLLLNQGQMGGMTSSHFNIFLFTILAFCFDDFLRFFHHLLMHRIPWLWRLHRTHHSAKVLTPLSLYRIHPLESAMATVRNSLSTGVMIGLFIFLFESQFNLFTVFGVNFFGFSFNFLASNLRHSHIPITFGFMEKVFISPKQHQIHHSTKASHYDKNFGVSLTVWDALNRSLIYSNEVHEPLRFGLQGGARGRSFRKLIFRP